MALGYNHDGCMMQPLGTYTIPGMQSCYHLAYGVHILDNTQGLLDTLALCLIFNEMLNLHAEKFAKESEE